MRTLPVQLIRFFSGTPIVDWSSAFFFDSIQRHTSHWLMNAQAVYDPFHRSKNLTIISSILFEAVRHQSNERIKLCLAWHRCSVFVWVAHADGISFILFSNFSVRSLCRPIRTTAGFFSLFLDISAAWIPFGRFYSVFVCVCWERCVARFASPQNQLKLNSVFDLIGSIYLHFGF